MRRIKQVSLAMVMAALVGCGSINATTGAFLNSSSASYEGARSNIQQKDDMALKAWADAACAMPMGALMRNATGNPNIVTAILIACPVPGLVTK